MAIGLIITILLSVISCAAADFPDRSFPVYFIVFIVIFFIGFFAVLGLICYRACTSGITFRGRPYYWGSGPHPGIVAGPAVHYQPAYTSHTRYVPAYTSTTEPLMGAHTGQGPTFIPPQTMATTGYPSVPPGQTQYPPMTGYPMQPSPVPAHPPSPGWNLNAPPPEYQDKPPSESLQPSAPPK